MKVLDTFYIFAVGDLKLSVGKLRLPRPLLPTFVKPTTLLFGVKCGWLVTLFWRLVGVVVRMSAVHCWVSTWMGDRLWAS